MKSFWCRNVATISYTTLGNFLAVIYSIFQNISLATIFPFFHVGKLRLADGFGVFSSHNGMVSSLHGVHARKALHFYSRPNHAICSAFSLFS